MTVSVEPLAVSCPFCKSAMSEQCTRHGSFGGPRKSCLSAHPSRYRKAALQAGCSVEEADQIADQHMTELVTRYRKRFPVEGESDGLSTAGVG